ncbi:MAG: HD domain-containing protein [Pirellulales bacterium]|nr:HD domain-containing protein [Pirellulales bacterium]
MLSSRFSDALLYAANLHAGQRRKASGEPYLAHLLGAASIVLDYGGNEDEAIAALLHDAIEDQGGPAARAEIRQRFGEGVAAIVEGCTDADAIPKPPWRPRKEAFLDRLRAAPPSVLLVVAADKLHNLRALAREYRRRGESLWQHFRGGREGTLWYHRSVVEILRQFIQSRDAGSPPAGKAAETAAPQGAADDIANLGGLTLLVEELDRAMQEFERLVSENVSGTVAT